MAPEDAADDLLQVLDSLVFGERDRDGAELAGEAAGEVEGEAEGEASEDAGEGATGVASGEAGGSLDERLRRHAASPVLTPPDDGGAPRWAVMREASLSISSSEGTGSQPTSRRSSQACSLRDSSRRGSMTPSEVSPD